MCKEVRKTLHREGRTVLLTRVVLQETNPGVLCVLPPHAPWASVGLLCGAVCCLCPPVCKHITKTCWPVGGCCVGRCGSFPIRGFSPSSEKNYKEPLLPGVWGKHACLGVSRMLRAHLIRADLMFKEPACCRGRELTQSYFLPQFPQEHWGLQALALVTWWRASGKVKGGKENTLPRLGKYRFKGTSKHKGKCTWTEDGNTLLPKTVLSLLIPDNIPTWQSQQRLESYMYLRRELH